MTGIITSCINPKENTKEVKSFLTLKQREEQTINTIKKLNLYDFKRLILVDNSFKYDFFNIQNQFPELKIIQIKQYQFHNKGINELLMLLAIIDELPENQPLFKISGRYFPNSDFKTSFDLNFDFKIKAYKLPSKRGTISTRGYFVKNKIIYEDFLLKTLSEVFGYDQRIVGPRSFIKKIIKIFDKRFANKLNPSIEFAAARVIKKEGYSYYLTDVLGIEGEIAGFKGLTVIKE